MKQIFRKNLIDWSNPNYETMKSEAYIIGKCISIFLLSILIWHVYRFVVTFSPYKSYFMWETLQGKLFYLVFYILMFAILVFFVRYIDHSSLKNIGLSQSARWKRHIAIGVFFAFLARFLEIGFGAVVGGVVIVYAYSSFLVIVFFVVDTFFVGLSEEGVFRGYIQGKLTGIWRFLPALLFASILFHIYHTDFFTASMTDLILKVLAVAPSFSIFAGYMYYKTRGNLLGPVALHMFYDLFGTMVPIGIDVAGVHPVMVQVSRIFMWSILIIVFKLLVDKIGFLVKVRV